MPELAKLPPSGIKVLIVGAGFGGLCAAIECNRKGHEVILLEKVKQLKPLGDVISFSSNSGHIFERWEGVVDELDPIVHKSTGLDFHDWMGNFATRQQWGDEKQWGRRINGHRGQIHDVVYKHAKARGVDIRLGQTVTDYFETDTEAGVVSNGEKVVADCVFAAEGVKSAGRKIVLGTEDPPKPSGYAVYRSWFDSDELAKNERTKHLVINGDTHTGWIGEDKHFLAASVKNGKEFSWVLTHKDDGDIEEDWQFPGNKDEVKKHLAGWAPVVHDIVDATPPDRLVDYKLVFRDPLPTFISPKARICLIGDAAHPFLPTSIQGASQSMEDGVTLAITLQKAGKADVPLAIRAYEAIRYGRVHRAQMTGVTTREQWHKADWNEIWKDVTVLHLKREAWLLDFDAETHAYEVVDDVLKDLRQGKPVKTETPPESEQKSGIQTVIATEVDQLA
ncbi:salicylate hydroxylase [Exophiala viscosa]|uniref:Salicylate hydroxylase n=1 Tax=Exophiala viscosa TaxID=2486360 RepID=A0AAN6DV23_9EURO|nr:salicylate hydroxylase [Exophiala viscosa]KAI1623228.1 salicylate hydroxylase [Exophiala viscosa]